MHVIDYQIFIQAEVAKRRAHSGSRHSWSWTHRQNRIERRHLSPFGTETPPGMSVSVLNPNCYCCY